MIVNPEPTLGARVAGEFGSTGRYLGHGMALIISAQDNGLMLVNADLIRTPHPTLPVPTDREVDGVQQALQYAWRNPKEPNQ